MQPWFLKYLCDILDINTKLDHIWQANYTAARLDIQNLPKRPWRGFFQNKTLLQNFSLMKRFLITAVFGSTAYIEMTFFFYFKKTKPTQCVSLAPLTREKKLNAIFLTHWGNQLCCSFCWFNVKSSPGSTSVEARTQGWKQVSSTLFKRTCIKFTKTLHNQTSEMTHGEVCRCFQRQEIPAASPPEAGDAAAMEHI